MHKLPTTYQEFIHLSRYSRWNYDSGRRETWEETVGRYFRFFLDHLSRNQNYSVKLDELNELKDAVLELEVMPSMRCLMTAGPALEKENVAGYNCSYLPIDTVRSFDEVLYTLMNGTGVGFSVEEKYTSQLPIVPSELHPTDTCIDVRDSKLGWAKAFRELISLLYAGLIPTWNMDKVRKAGSILKTFGGRASGPDPLNKLFFSLENYLKMQKDEDSDLSNVMILLRKPQKLLSLVVFVGVLSLALVTLGMSRCDSQSQEHGGKITPIDPSQIIQPIITPSQTQGLSLESGLPYMTRNLESVASIVHTMQENRSKNSTTEILEMTSGRIHVLK